MVTKTGTTNRVSRRAAVPGGRGKGPALLNEAQDLRSRLLVILSADLGRFVDEMVHHVEARKGLDELSQSPARHPRQNLRDAAVLREAARIASQRPYWGFSDDFTIGDFLNSEAALLEQGGSRKRGGQGDSEKQGLAVYLGRMCLRYQVEVTITEDGPIDRVLQELWPHYVGGRPPGWSARSRWLKAAKQRQHAYDAFPVERAEMMRRR